MSFTVDINMSCITNPLSVHLTSSRALDLVFEALLGKNWYLAEKVMLLVRPNKRHQHWTVTESLIQHQKDGDYLL